MSETHHNTSPDSLSAIQAALFKPVDIASLAFFRIAFGTILLWEVWRYFDYGWIERYYIEPEFHFTYYGFEWVRPWSGGGMFLHFDLPWLLFRSLRLCACPPDRFQAARSPDPGRLMKSRLLPLRGCAVDPPGSLRTPCDYNGGPLQSDN